MGFLRLLLAISVVIAHTGPLFGLHFVGGGMAVQIFFIISGFYMSLILNEKYIGSNNSYRLFLSNRLLRLFPVYWAVLLIALATSFLVSFIKGHPTGAILPYTQYHNDMSFSTFFYLFFTNICLIGQDVLTFLGLDTHTGSFFFTRDFHQTNPPVYAFLVVPQAWSLSLEICFYLMAPFLVRRKLGVICSLIALSLVARILVTRYSLPIDPWLTRFFPTQFAFFLAGNVSYRIYKKIEHMEIKRQYLFSMAMIMFVYTIFFDKLPIPAKANVYFILFMGLLPFIFKYTKRMKWDNKVGELSYPIYICHWFVYFVVSETSFEKFLGPTITVTVCSILFSMLLIKFIADPIERIRQSRVKSGFQTTKARAAVAVS